MNLRDEFKSEIIEKIENKRFDIYPIIQERKRLSKQLDDNKFLYSDITCGIYDITYSSDYTTYNAECKNIKRVAVIQVNTSTKEIASVHYLFVDNIKDRQIRKKEGASEWRINTISRRAFAKRVIRHVSNLPIDFNKILTDNIEAN